MFPEHGSYFSNNNNITNTSSSSSSSSNSNNLLGYSDQSKTMEHHIYTEMLYEQEERKSSSGEWGDTLWKDVKRGTIIPDGTSGIRLPQAYQEDVGFGSGGLFPTPNNTLITGEQEGGKGEWVWSSNWRINLAEKGADHEGWVLIDRGKRRRMWTRTREFKPFNLPISGQQQRSRGKSNSVNGNEGSSSLFFENANSYNASNLQSPVVTSHPSKEVGVMRAGYSHPHMSSAEQKRSDAAALTVASASPLVPDFRVKSVYASVESSETHSELCQEAAKLLVSLVKDVQYVQSRAGIIGTSQDSQILRDEIQTIISRIKLKLNEVETHLSRLEGIEKSMRSSTTELSTAKFSRSRIANDFDRVSQQFETVKRRANEKDRNTTLVTLKNNNRRVNNNNNNNNNNDNSLDAEDENDTKQSLPNQGVYMSKTDLLKLTQQRLVLEGDVSIQNELLLEEEVEHRKILNEFTKLHELQSEFNKHVVHQGEVIESAAKNVSNANHHTKQALSEIYKADEYQSNSSWTIS